MLRLVLEPAYVLHAWPYGESSLLLDVFTREHGRVGVLAKGVKKPRSLYKSLLQPFVPLWISCAGKELLLLKSVELRGQVCFLKARSLLCALYMNELCVRLMHRFDPYPSLFDHYEQALNKLLQMPLGDIHPCIRRFPVPGIDAPRHHSERLIRQSNRCEQKILRIFEKSLLKALGYALPLERDAKSGEALQPEAWYHFDPERGPILEHNVVSKPMASEALFKGSTLLALAHECLEDASVLPALKSLMKQVLALYLGPKPLQTRFLL